MKGCKRMLIKKEVTQKDKKIIYEIHTEKVVYKGITIDIIDLNEPMERL